MESMRDWHVYIAIIVLGTAVYGKSIFFEYTYADDTQLLVVNQEFLSHLSNLPKLFTTEVFLSMSNPNLYYRPLLNVLFMLEFQVSDGSPLFFHIVSLLLHLGCSLLVYKLFKQLRAFKFKRPSVRACFLCSSYPDLCGNMDPGC